jgi:hypothetical protein
MKIHEQSDMKFLDRRPTQIADSVVSNVQKMQTYFSQQRDSESEKQNLNTTLKVPNTVNPSYYVPHFTVVSVIPRVFPCPQYDHIDYYLCLK